LFATLSTLVQMVGGDDHQGISKLQSGLKAEGEPAIVGLVPPHRVPEFRRNSIRLCSSTSGRETRLTQNRKATSERA
jgi:hypothetical protein